MKTSTKKMLVLGAVVLGAAIAWAAPPPSMDIFRWVKGGLSIGRTGAPPSDSAQNNITDTRGTYFAYQFGALLAPAWGNVTGGCTNGPTIAKTGVRVGDVCMVASDRSNWDGGIPDFVRFDCEVPAAGYVKLRACVSSNDGGVAISVIDAGYYFRTFSMTAN